MPAAAPTEEEFINFVRRAQQAFWDLMSIPSNMPQQHGEVGGDSGAPPQDGRTAFTI